MPPHETAGRRENRPRVSSRVPAGGQTSFERCPPAGTSGRVAHLEELGDDAHRDLFG
jgi:hypothetical protein